MKRWAKVLFLIVVFFAPSLTFGAIFKCVASDGLVTFSDTPCSLPEETEIIDDIDSRNSKGIQQSLESQNAWGILPNHSLVASPPNYIEIPPEPVKPKAPDVHTRIVHGTPHMVPSMQGGFVLRTGERSYTDPTTGHVGQGEFIGGSYDRTEQYVDLKGSRSYREAMREYNKAKYNREVAIEAEKYSATVEDRNASPQYCGEMQVKIKISNQRDKSLKEQLKKLESSRPSSKASAKQRSAFHHRRQDSRARIKDKMSQNRMEKSEASGNYRRLCR